MTIDTSYKNYIEQLKSEILKARVKAVLSVNKELILMYWRIGKKILEMQKKRVGVLK